MIKIFKVYGLRWQLLVFQQLFCKSNASTRMQGHKKKLELDFA
jgi:hypothetical protein